jgi:hypothetical protein
MRNRCLCAVAFLPAILCWGQTPEAPALLSRGLAAESGLPRAGVLQPYAGAFSGYDNGPLSTSLDRPGGAFQEVEGGLSFLRRGTRAEIRLDYRFDLRHYQASSRLDRSNQALTVDTRFHISRRWTVMLRDTGSSASYDSPSQPAGTGVAEGFLVGVGPEVFHSRTIAQTGMADVIFAPTARTSVSVGGDGFLIQRQFAPLIDAVGWRARADVARRYSRHRTVSLSYSFTHFDHARSFGGAEYAVFALGHSVRLSRRSEIDLLAGAGRLQSAGLRAVSLDPEISRLLGISRGVETFHLDTWAPHVTAAWVQGVGRAELRVQFAREVTDGGGLTGLARQNEGSLAFQTAHVRSAWRPGIHIIVRTYRSLDTILYSNVTASAGLSLARRLGSQTEAVVRYDFGFYNFEEGLLRNFQRRQFAAGVTCYFSGRATPPNFDRAIRP